MRARCYRPRNIEFLPTLVRGVGYRWGFWQDPSPNLLLSYAISILSHNEISLNFFEVFSYLFLSMIGQTIESFGTGALPFEGVIRKLSFFFLGAHCATHSPLRIESSLTFGVALATNKAHNKFVSLRKHEGHAPNSWWGNTKWHRSARVFAARQFVKLAKGNFQFPKPECQWGWRFSFWYRTFQNLGCSLRNAQSFAHWVFTNLWIEALATPHDDVLRSWCY